MRGETGIRKTLPRTFYLQQTVRVARALLGKILVRHLGKNILTGRIVEVEAYHERGDRASHSARGRTRRNEVMFREGGHLYVYFTYGMHYCMNVVTEAEGIGSAVLIRAVEPLGGIESMRRHRGHPAREIDLANGPAKCCRAFGITGRDNGIDLVDGEITIIEADPPGRGAIGTSTRVGIRESAEKPWRFFIRGNPFVSGHRMDAVTEYRRGGTGTRRRKGTKA